MENKQSNMQIVLVDQDGNRNVDEGLPPGISVANFDYSAENHLKALDKILELSGESKFEYDQSEIQRMSSSVTFLRDWRHFCYQPQAVRFACQSETSQSKDVASGIVNLTQFSSAAVPKDLPGGDKMSSHSSKDFVMYVGGLVWAMDWCPRVHERPDCDIKLEFIAVAAHSPESSYHKIGAPLTGRGVIQIWSLLNHGIKNQDMIPHVNGKLKKNLNNNKETNPKTTQPTKPRGRPRKNPINQVPEDSTMLLLTDGRSHDNTLEIVAIEKHNVTNAKPKRPRGRPKKNQLNESTEKQISSVKPMGNDRNKETKDSVDNLDSSNQHVKPLTVEFPEDNINVNQYLKPLAIKFHEDSSKLGEITIETPEVVSKEDGSTTHEKVTKKDFTRKRKAQDEENLEKSMLIGSEPTLTKCKLRLKSGTSSLLNADTSSDCGQDPMRSNEDVALPRLIMCLAHNGKVAWDVKWRPFDTCVSSKHRMGYLAVLLGNGALEVWEVPAPHAAQVMFSACQKEGTDPRFIKLEPVFRCSKLKCGDRHSIPLTLEWSTSSPHDLILAGCHDGVVALWKFSADGPLKDTRPLLCFSADTGPIRALAWAPVPSDSESANLIVTAGHKGVKFWDIRDPFRPLWDNPVHRIIYGLDWHPDPRCVVVSFDDGEIQIISLSKAACDVPVTGAPFVEAHRHASHSYKCSPSSIMSVHVSKLTGMVAYCCIDGTVLHFQLTTKAVEKDPARNREPHYLCGGVTLEESGLTVLSTSPNVPFRMKKSSNEWGDTPRSRRGFISRSNQEKRATEQMLKCQPPQPQPQPLALCYDSGSEESGGLKRDEKEEVPLPPAKIVGMHSVRWNINKGSERWLASGGAAGILRCQQIN